MTTPTPPTEPTPASGQAPPSPPEEIEAAGAAYLATVVTPWLATITPAVLPGPGVIDPYGVLSGTAQWLAGLTRWMRDNLRPRLLDPFLALFGVDRGTAIFDQQPFVIAYNQQVRNLLVRTPDEVFTKIRTMVSEAADEGTPIPDLAEQIRDTLLDANAPYWNGRATTIARTELRRAQMGGLFGSYSTYGEANNVEYIKTWMDSDDLRVRPAHVDTDGQRRRMMEPFAVGVDGGPKFTAMYPLDPILPVELSANCRCDMTVEEAGERMTDMSNRGFRG